MYIFILSTVIENDFSESDVKVRLVIDISGFWPKEKNLLFEGLLKISPSLYGCFLYFSGNILLAIATSDLEIFCFIPDYVFLKKGI